MFSDSKNNIKLSELLADVKSSFSLEDVKDLIEGQISAPSPLDRSTWMNLVVEEPSESLKKSLTTFEEQCRVETEKNSTKICCGSNLLMEVANKIVNPVVNEIKVKRKGDVHKAKLYYLRERSGRSARIKEKI